MITTKRPTKFFAMITYVVALICIVLGFFYPYGTVQGTNGMIAMQLPNVINTLFGTSMDVGAQFAFPSAPIVLFGIEALTIENTYAWLIFAYAVVAVLGLLALIPICVSNRYKSTAKIFANIIEILALIVLGLYVFKDSMMHQAAFTTSSGVSLVAVDNWTPYIAFGGVGIVYIIQNIATKGSSGIIKSLLFILSALSMYALTMLYGLLTTFPDIFNNLCNTLHAVPGLYSTSTRVSGLDVGYSFFAGTFFDKMGSLSSASEKIVYILALATCLLVTLNFFLDMFGLAKKTNKGMLICNLVRFGLLLVVAAVLAIMVAVLKGQLGLMLYIILVVTVIQTLINVFRFLKYLKAKKQVASVASSSLADTEIYGENFYEQLESESTPIVAAPVAAPAPVYQAPTPAPAPVVAPIYPTPIQPTPAPVQTTEYQQVYNISSVYNGPSDEFIKKLTNDEKIEFAKVFLERRYGPLSVIPTYNFGGDNKKFFSAIFIYISRVREHLSDGLMNKIYEELNLLKN